MIRRIKKSLSTASFKSHAYFPPLWVKVELVVDLIIHRSPFFFSEVVAKWRSPQHPRYRRCHVSWCLLSRDELLMFFGYKAEKKEYKNTLVL
jgi:hypothetical protein